MVSLTSVLRCAAPIFIVVGCLHLVLGVSAELLLGADLPQSALDDPVLDSQNRFYGVAFSLYGVLLFVCTRDLKRYAPVLRWLLWIFFAGGVARLVSIASHGLPSVEILTLTAFELVPPPLLLIWLGRIEPSTASKYAD